MCFSAEASFITSAGLAVIGYNIIQKVKRGNSKIIWVAYAPLLFSMQQLCEGFVWMGYQGFPAYCFLFFALIIWPSYLPFAFFELETEQAKKNLLLIAQGIGLVVTATLALLLYTYGFAAQIACHHIAYSINAPFNALLHQWGIACYATAALSPFFISSKKNAWKLGILAVFSLIATMFIYFKYFTSVWCFFAAVISGSLYYFL